MTVAVCLKCGAMKHGAFNPCPKCHYVPTEAEDRARHVMVTDHLLSRADLESISARIQNGLPVQLDPQMVADFAETAREMDAEPKGFRGMFVGICITIVILVIAIACAVGLVWHFLK